MPTAKTDELVVIIAPVGQDAEAMAALLDTEGFRTEVFGGLAEACQKLSNAGALLLTEEALELPQISDLLAALKTQPPWSGLPLIILTTGGESRLVKLLDLAVTAAGSVTLLERPISAATLLRSVEVALRSRRRQYQVRDLLEEQRRRQLELEQAKSRAENELAERKRTEQRLAEQARLLDLSNDAIIVRDPQDRILYWNRGAEQIYGYNRADALGKI